jgi:hypothetical protein
MPHYFRIKTTDGDKITEFQHTCLQQSTADIYKLF